MNIASYRTEGLGDSTYVLEHDGIGVLVDPQRDVDRFLRDHRSLEFRYVLETHVHNDYVSGGREAAAKTGAELVVPAAAGVAYDHLPAFHLEDLEATGFSIRPLHTPGHTPEHTSYAVIVEGRVVAVFSGGSLLVMSAGRTDLLGGDRARSLARLQYGSVHRLAELPGHVELYPTHGEGSFCTASGAGRYTSTIEQERRENPVFRYSDADAFAEGQLAGLLPYPDYYAYMGPTNLVGPTPLPDSTIGAIDPVDVVPGDVLLDIRPRAAFAEAHAADAVGIELAENTGVWAGWLFPFDSPVVIFAEPDQDVREVVVQLHRIGFDHIRGVIFGIEPWVAAGKPIRGCGIAAYRQLADALASDDPPQVLDVRDPAEWAAGHIDGSVHRYLPDLRDGVPAALDQSSPVWVICRSGHRATAAAGLLEGFGYEPIIVADGGVTELLDLAPVPSAGA